MFSIDSRSRMAIYEQLVQNIIGLIARGVLQPDDQLPVCGTWRVTSASTPTQCKKPIRNWRPKA